MKKSIKRTIACELAAIMAFMNFAVLGTDEQSAQWYSLPYSGYISDKEIYGFRSPLPYIEEIDDASRLNELAEKVATLDRNDLVKLKAVMELGEVEDISGTIDAINSLSEFDFDPNLR